MRPKHYAIFFAAFLVCSPYPLWAGNSTSQTVAALVVKHVQGCELASDSPVEDPVKDLSSIRPRDIDAQLQFDELVSAIRKLPKEQIVIASRTLVRTVNQIGPNVFNGYLASNFLNTWSGKKSAPRELAGQLANGNQDKFEREVMGSGPFEP
jgi:hypothetical protein